MLTGILIVCILIFLGAVFYKQTVQEYKLNQIEWSQRERIPELLEEGTPFVVRSAPLCPVWNATDVGARAVFTDLATWVQAAPPTAKMPWHRRMSLQYGKDAVLAPWLEETWLPHTGTLRSTFPALFPQEIQAWVGGRGLYPLKAMWSIIFPTEGDIIVTLMSAKEDKYLPVQYFGKSPQEFTNADTPYVSKLKYLDIKLRSGVALFVPAHWKVAWAAADDTSRIPFVCIYSLHTPISKLAAMLSAI